ncbi:MAG: tetratricopeptide repeat protein, partial [Desulfobacteraceae bacterium]
ILLVLDSFEHLLEGAELLMDFLNAAPYLKILVTSRQRLNLKWEWVLEIQGLDYPRNENEQDIEQFDAVQLFLQSVQRIHPGFSLSAAERPFVARICRFLEGMPLGLELAATWARMLSSREIASEVERNSGFLATTLSDIPERHRSLQKVFDYSWQLLSEEEKIVLKRLSVFRGGFGKEAAEKVGRVSLQMLMALINKSFLYRNRNGRFEMLEVIRQFIKEQIPPAVENPEEIQIRHADYYMRFLSQRDQPAKISQYKRAMDEIGMEIENIRAGWQWSVLNKNTTMISQYLDSLFFYYELKGWYFYGEDALAKAVVVLQYSYDLQAELKGVIAKALSAQGWLCHFSTHFQKAKGLLQTSISIFEQLKMKPELGTAFFRLGHVLYDIGQLKHAEEWINKGLSVFKEINDVQGLWACVKNIGNIRLISEAYAEAKSLYGQCLNAYRAMGDSYHAAGVLLNLGILMELQEQFHEAKRFYGESLLCYREIGDQTRMSICLTDLGFAHYYCDEYPEAEAYFKESLQIALKGNSRFMTQGALLGIATVRMQPENQGMVFEIIGQILNDPLTHVWDRKRTERLLERLRPQFSEAFLKSSMEKGKNTDLAYYTDWYRTNGILRKSSIDDYDNESDNE